MAHFLQKKIFCMVNFWAPSRLFSCSYLIVQKRWQFIKIMFNCFYFVAIEARIRCFQVETFQVGTEVYMITEGSISQRFKPFIWCLWFWCSGKTSVESKRSAQFRAFSSPLSPSVHSACQAVNVFCRMILFLCSFCNGKLISSTSGSSAADFASWSASSLFAIPEWAGIHLKVIFESEVSLWISRIVLSTESIFFKASNADLQSLYKLTISALVVVSLSSWIAAWIAITSPLKTERCSAILNWWKDHILAGYTRTIPKPTFPPSFFEAFL